MVGVRGQRYEALARVSPLFAISATKFESFALSQTPPPEGCRGNSQKYVTLRQYQSSHLLGIILTYLSSSCLVEAAESPPQGCPFKCLRQPSM